MTEPTALKQLLDELVNAHKVIGLDRKWHKRQIAAREAVVEFHNRAVNEARSEGIIEGAESYRKEGWK